MSKLKIAVYAICKNEEKFVDRWMDAVKEADMVIVADTGSNDSTVKKLKSRGAICHEIKVDPWRFDVARNRALSFVPEDVDICVSTDLDEVFEPGWREKIEKVWTPETSRLHYLFSHGGNTGPKFWKEKIHKRHGFKWVRPVHEILEYVGEEPYSALWEESIQLNHYPDRGKPRSQYLPLLELSAKEFPDDDRNMHYLGREYMYYGMWDKCIETLKHHLSMPNAGWKDERCASMRFIARAYKAKNDMDLARSWLYKAIAEAPHTREPYVEMARLAYDEKDWPRVYHMVEEALKIRNRPASYLNEAFCWDATIYDLGANSCFVLGMFKKAYEFVKTAVEMAPHDKRLKSNMEMIESKLNSKYI